MRRRFVLLAMILAVMQPGVARGSACQCDDYKVTGQVEQLEKLHHRIRAADAGFFDEAGKLLGETGRFLPDLQRMLRKGRAKWTFSGVRAVADGVAAIASAGLGAAMSGAPGGDVAGMMATMGEMELSGADHLYAIVNRKNMSSDAHSMLRKAKRRLRRHLEAMADDEDKLLGALADMEEIARALQKCSRCVIRRRHFSAPPSIDPKHPENRFFQQMIRQSGATPPCDTCADIQALFDYVDGMRAMFRARKALLNQLIQSQRTIVLLYLDAIKVVSRDRWSETLAGRVGDLATTALAAGSGGVGGVVKVGFSKLFDYLEARAVAPGLKSILGNIRERQRVHSEMGGWFAPGGEWDQAQHALDRNLWRMLRYRYGKCEICEEKKDRTSRGRLPRAKLRHFGKPAASDMPSAATGESALSPGSGQTRLPGGSTGIMHGTPGSSGACIPGAADLPLPIIRDMPASESLAGRAKATGKQMLGGLLGGGSAMFGGGGPFGGGGGPRMVRRPKGPWDILRAGETGIELAGWTFVPRHGKRPPLIRIAVGVKDSPFQGAPDSVWLQDANGNLLQPVGYMIYEIWVHWKLTITITREHYINGKLVSRSVTRESTQWKELLERYKLLLMAPSIWERLKSRPFGKLRGVIVEFPLPEGFDPSQWSLVAHVTAKDTMNGKEVIKTTPFVADVVPGKGRRLRFRTAEDGSAYQKAHSGCARLGRLDVIREMYKGDTFGVDAWQSRIRETQRGLPTRRASRPPENRRKAPSRHQVRKVKMDAAHWGRIVVLQRQPLEWLKRFHELEGEQQQLASIFMADLALRMFAGLNVEDAIKARHMRWQQRMGKVARNLAIEAARRWMRGGLDAGQKRQVAEVFRKLTPELRRVFAQEFVSTLGVNLFLDLRQPKPAAY